MAPVSVSENGELGLALLHDVLFPVVELRFDVLCERECDRNKLIHYGVSQLSQWRGGHTSAHHPCGTPRERVSTQTPSWAAAAAVLAARAPDVPPVAAPAPAAAAAAAAGDGGDDEEGDDAVTAFSKLVSALVIVPCASPARYAACVTCVYTHVNPTHARQHFCIQPCAHGCRCFPPTCRDFFDVIRSDLISIC